MNKRSLQNSDWPMTHRTLHQGGGGDHFFLVIIWEGMWFLVSFKQKIICLNGRLASLNNVVLTLVSGVVFE